MLRSLLPLMTGLLAVGCLSSPPTAAHVVGTSEPLAVAPRPASSAAWSPGAPAAAQPAAAGKTLYGARFEPPKGRILHGMGNFDDGNAGYLSLLQGTDLQPASRLLYRAIGDWPRNWDNRLQQFRVELLREAELGRIPQIDLGLFGIEDGVRHRTSVDHEVASSTRWDSHIREVAQVIAAHAGPVFVRIGGEFSGEWMDYHPYDYPIAFRKIVGIFREEAADNVAFVWCYEPAAPDDFDQHDARGWRWYPGDDVVDWFGIDVFSSKDFSPQGRGRGQEANYARTERFLKMARDRKKPVMIGECSPSMEEITADPRDGRRDWDTWFAPFLAFLDDHPEIEAFYLINYDWRESSSSETNGWLQAEIEINPYISEKWVKALRDPRFLHLDEVSLLDGYAATLTRPPYKGPGPPDPLDADPRKGRGQSRP